jgi:hypothetical protein
MLQAALDQVVDHVSVKIIRAVLGNKA